MLVTLFTKMVLQAQGKGHKGSGEEIWAGEKYEPSAVQGVDAGFLKFAKNLRRNPDQCIRLRFDSLGSVHAFD